MFNSGCCEGENKYIFKILCIIFAALIIIWLAVDVINKINNGQEAKNTITVSDTGTVYAKPDLALTTFSVITEAKTVGEALSQNTEKMNAVIKSIKEKGVEEKDLKTTNFSIYPRYEYQKIETNIYPYPPGKRVLTGYEVSQSLQVKIRDLTKVGDIIQIATEKGANDVGDLQFTIEKEDELKNQARAEAIKKAKQKARDLTSQLGVRLGRISNFSESGRSPYFYFSEKAISAPSAGGAAPNIETGENKIEVTVNITYEIK